MSRRVLGFWIVISSIGLTTFIMAMGDIPWPAALGAAVIVMVIASLFAGGMALMMRDD